MRQYADKKQLVKEYYGKVLNGKGDLRSSACCTAESMPPEYRPVIELIDGEILDKFYGCGSPLPPALEGCTVLDLGCGTGRDAYLASYLVGPSGRVIGVDMTEEQLEVARRHIAPQARRFGHLRPNVTFHHGYIEDLAALEVKDASVDVVISNCVINLSSDKRSVFKEISRVLKPGGELYFSDVFAGCRLPRALAEDPDLYGECLGGALYIEDFRRLLEEIGIRDHRVVNKRRIELQDPELVSKAGHIAFYSMTIRAFRLEGLEDICEDYGQIATYRGTIPGLPHVFILDDHHHLMTRKPTPVCGNTAAMLQETRYRGHFDVMGDRSVHFGPFRCAGENVGRDIADPKDACC